MSDAPIFLTAKQIKAEELALLLEFDEFCRDNKIRYSLCGGTLLGAIRHKGFIPWDDDIDVMVPRDDFDKFVHLCQSGRLKNFYSIEIMPLENASPIFVKFVNEQISLRERYVAGVHHLWIDVFPVDGLPAQMRNLKREFHLANLFRRIALICRADSHDGKSTFKKIFKRFGVPIFTAIHLGEFVVQRLDRLCRKYKFGATKYVGIVGWGLYGPGERYPSAAFDNMISVSFEGHEFPAIPCWDEYLTGIYGDYMQLPPIEKRQTHGLEAWKTVDGRPLTDELETR